MLDFSYQQGQTAGDCRVSGIQLHSIEWNWGQDQRRWSDDQVAVAGLLWSLIATAQRPGLDLQGYPIAYLAKIG